MFDPIYRAMLQSAPAAERASVLRSKILADVQEGRFKLSRGYGWFQVEDGVALGCALGAASFSVCGTKDYDGTIALIGGLTASGLMSADDCDALEIGFEGWPPGRVAHDDPFRLLGVELRGLVKDEDDRRTAYDTDFDTRVRL